MTARVPIIGSMAPPRSRPRHKKKPSERMKLTKAQRDVFVSMGHKGGTMRAKNLSQDELSSIGKKAAAARWKKRNRKKK